MFYFCHSMESKRSNPAQSWRIGGTIMRSRLFRGVMAFTVLGLFYMSLFVSHQHVNVFSIVGGVAGLVATVRSIVLNSQQNLYLWLKRLISFLLLLFFSFLLSLIGYCDCRICTPRFQSLFHFVLACHVRSWCGIALRACASL